MTSKVQIPDTSSEPGLQATANQLALADELKVSATDRSNTESLVRAIEQKTGQNTLLEHSRWFLLSVLKHLSKADWDSPAESNLARERQYALARDFIATDEMQKSLGAILKDDRCKFTLVGFAKTRKPEKRVLSFTTKAYRRAVTFLEQTAVHAGQTPAPPRAPVSGKNTSLNTSSVVSRRAARRGYFGEEALDIDLRAESVIQQSVPQQSSAMSEEEYAELNKVLEDSENLAPQQNWHYRNNEDRFSLMLGAAAGFGVFAVVLWVFL